MIYVYVHNISNVYNIIFPKTLYIYSAHTTDCLASSHQLLKVNRVQIKKNTINFVERKCILLLKVAACLSPPAPALPWC